MLSDLFKKLQNQLRYHEGLIALDQRRYQQKIKDATSDDDGINALEQLLETDPALAEMFGSMVKGKVAAKTIAASMAGVKVEGEAPKFEGTEFPSYFRRKDGSTAVDVELPQNDGARCSFLTDVKNNYFTRSKYKGKCELQGLVDPSVRLFDGRLTFTFHPEKVKKSIGTKFEVVATISDAAHGPWILKMRVKVIEPREKQEHAKHQPKPPMTDAAPSRPDIIDVHNGPDGEPIVLAKVSGTDRVQLQINVDSHLLVEAKVMRPPAEARAVEFVFKYGLALIAMGLLDAAKKTEEWEKDEKAVRDRVSKAAAGVGRVIVPLCLTLPKKLPKAA